VIFLLGVYFLGAGLLLAVAPWTTWWEHNLFASLLPDLSLWMGNTLVRAAVSAVGLLTIATGLVDVRTSRRMRVRPRGAAGAPVPPSPAPPEP
jgi:hypothetical protein